MTAPVLFEITAADSHLQIILPVIRLLKQRGIPAVVYSDCELLRTPSDIATLEKEGIEYVWLAREPLPVADAPWDAIAIPIRRKIPSEVERTRPSLVVVLNDRNFPSIVFVETARKLRIPSMLLQESLRKDLFQRPTLKKLFFRWKHKIQAGIEGGLRKYGQGNCDAYAAWGETSREYLRKVGVPEKKITITGNPRFDQLANPDFSKEGDAIRQKYQLVGGSFLLTFLSSPIEKMLIISREEKQAAFEKLLDWATQYRDLAEGKDFRLAFKLHRSENADLFRQMLQDRNMQDFCFVADTALYPLLSISQAALMFSTTAGLEAALLRVPVGIFVLSRPLDDWDFAKRGVARNVASFEDYSKFVHDAKTNRQLGEANRKAAHFYLANVGSASEHVAALIENTVLHQQKK